jgi:hypothetical protein
MKIGYGEGEEGFWTLDLGGAARVDTCVASVDVDVAAEPGDRICWMQVLPM